MTVQHMGIDIRPEFAKHIRECIPPPLLKEQDASVGTVIDSQHVQDLPLNGRQFTQLLQFSPGAVPDINSTLYKNANPAQAGRQRNGNPVIAVNGASGHGCRGLK